MENWNEQRVARLQHRFKIRRVAEQWKRCVVNIGDVDLTRVGGEPTGERVQAVALARRIKAHIFVALQHQGKAQASQNENKQAEKLS